MDCTCDYYGQARYNCPCGCEVCSGTLTVEEEMAL